MNLKMKPSRDLFLAALILAVTSGTAQAQTPDSDAVQTFAGPGSVPGQLEEDRRLTESLTDVGSPQDYADWKKSLREKYGLDFTVDYNTTVIRATNTLNDEDVFAGGVIRFFGQWDLVGRDSGNLGSLIFKVENRHKYTDIAPNGTKNEIGYIGLISPTFSNIKSRLTNLYWKQNLNENRVEIVAGFIDTTDWIDVWALAPTRKGRPRPGSGNSPGRGTGR